KQEQVFAVRSSEVEPVTELVQGLGLTESESAIAPANQLASLAPLESIPRRTSRREGRPEGQLTLF
ncbi:MAG TPA: hypothetical protein VGR71_02540, partial [Nitrospira sp.]|nr:hypothetical protein [Nitrospira sp.]